MKKIIILSLILFAFLGAFSQLSCRVNVDSWGEPSYSTPFIYRVTLDNGEEVIKPVPANYHFPVQTGQSGGYITVTHDVLPQVKDNVPGPIWKVWLSPNYITVRFEKDDSGSLDFDFKWYRMRLSTYHDANYQEAD